MGDVNHGTLKSEHRRLTRSRVVSGVCAVATALLVAAPPASAAAIERCSPVGCVTGNITVGANRTSWNLEVTDAHADGFCVYAKIQIDVRGGIDPDFRSENSCPKGHVIPFSGSDAYADTQGAAVDVCRSDGMCRRVHYERT